MQYFYDSLTQDKAKKENQRYYFLVALGNKLKEKIITIIPEKQKSINLIEGRLKQALKACKYCNVYILPKGAIENYLLSYTNNPYQISDKNKQDTFNKEQDWILEHSSEEVEQEYRELIEILDAASESTTINLDLYISYAIGDWIHKVQFAFIRGEIKDKISLENNPTLECTSYFRLFDLLEFIPTSDNFCCKIQLKRSVDNPQRIVEFDLNTVPATYKLEQ